MKGGTYAEALKSGFNEEQAGMLARLGYETRNEAVTEARGHSGVEEEEYHGPLPRWVTFVMGVAVGAVAMMVIHAI